MIRFHKRYFLLALGLLGTEVLIAAYAHDRLIRPYGGDFLAVIFLYCLARSFWSAPVRQVVLAALLVAYAIEGAQYFNLLAHLGLTHVRLVRIVLGSSFAWGDMLAYTAGALAVVGIERACSGAPRLATE